MVENIPLLWGKVQKRKWLFTLSRQVAKTTKAYACCVNINIRGTNEPGTSIIDFNEPNWDADDNSPRSDLKLCLLFVVHTNIEIWRHKKSNLTMEPPDSRLLSEVLGPVFDSSERSFEPNMVFGLVLKVVESEHYFHAHESNKDMECFKLVKTKEGITKIKTLQNSTNVIKCFRKKCSCKIGVSQVSWRDTFFCFTEGRYCSLWKT